jgi:lytic murein transglycosylase
MKGDFERHLHGNSLPLAHFHACANAALPRIVAGEGVPDMREDGAIMPAGRNSTRAFGKAALAGMLFLGLIVAPANASADAAFQRWLEGVWPQAQKLGVSRATFDMATRNLAPDLSLPDLDLPGKRGTPQPGQAEFVRTPADYIKESTIARLAAQARKLRDRYRATLTAIERKYGVPSSVLLAIWGRETDFGHERQPKNVVTVLATQAYTGRRKDFFRNEFIYALKMLQDKEVTLTDMRGSWGGAMGMTQFLPSEFYKYAVDFDGDGKKDIWHSVPDALASAAQQLVGKGWKRGVHWAYEVRAPANVDCTVGVPSVTHPLREWIRHGYQPVHGRKSSAADLAEPASLLQPEGTYGPAFLTLKNYYVIKEYNYSDLYVLFVGHLSERIDGERGFATPWSKDRRMRTHDVEAMQRTLTQLGLYKDKIDGKAGMLTRAALGAYQKRNGLKVDCWPTDAVLTHMQRKVGRN